MHHLYELTWNSPLAAFDINRVVTWVAESSGFFVHQETVGAGDLLGDTFTAFPKLLASGFIRKVAVGVRAVVGYIVVESQNPKTNRQGN